MLAEFLADFVDSDQAALAEQPDQDLQSSPTFWLYTLCYGHLKFVVLYLCY